MRRKILKNFKVKWQKRGKEKYLKTLVEVLLRTLHKKRYKNR